MKTITNTFELAEAVLEFISDKIGQTNSHYSYTLYPDINESETKNSTSIKIYNSNKDMVLFIHDEFIEIKDIIAEELNKELKRLHSEKMRELVNTMSIDELQYLSTVYNSVDIPDEVYTKFCYYHTEDMWFQQCTLKEDVLSFESTLNIQKIKRNILQDIENQWML